MAEIKKCLIISRQELPENLKEKVERIQGDFSIHHSELTMDLYSQGMKSIEDYYKDQQETNGFLGTIDEFIVDYRLEVDKWIIEQGFDFFDVNLILFKK